MTAVTVLVPISLGCEVKTNHVIIIEICAVIVVIIQVRQSEPKRHRR